MNSYWKYSLFLRKEELGSSSESEGVTNRVRTWEERLSSETPVLENRKLAAKDLRKDCRVKACTSGTEEARHVCVRAREQRHTVCAFWAKSLRSCLTLQLPTFWTGAHQAPLPVGFSRQEHWSGLPTTQAQPYKSKNPSWGFQRDLLSEFSEDCLTHWWAPSSKVRSAPLILRHSLRCVWEGDIRAVTASSRPPGTGTVRTPSPVCWEKVTVQEDR